MAAEAHIKAVITADDRASKTVGTFGTKLGDLSVGAAAAGAAIFGMGKMAIDFGIESVKAFTESERATKMLENAVINVSHATREQLNETNKLAEAISKKGVLDDDVIKQGLAQLSTFGLQNKTVQRLAQSMADLTVNQFGVKATGEQAEAAANMMAKALRGQFSILEKSGIIFSDAQKNTILFGTESEKASAVIEGFARNLKYTNDVARLTGEGALAAMDVTLGNMQETIGQALLPAILILADKLAEFVSSDTFKNWLEKVTAWIRDELPKFMTKLFDEYIPKAKAAFEEWAPKIMLVVNVLGAIAGAILWVGGVINDTSANIGLAIGYIVLWFNDAKNAIENFGYNAYNTMLRARDTVLRWAESVGLAIFGVINFFRTLPAQISSAIGGLGSLLYNSGRDLIQGLINGVRSMAGAVWQAIKDVTKDVIQTAKNMLGIKSPSIVFKGIGENIGKGMAQGIEASANLVQGSMIEMAAPSQAQQAAQPTAVSRQNSTEINISLSGIFTGTPGEARKLAEMVADNLKTIAGSHNTTVTQMLGG